MPKPRPLELHVNSLGKKYLKLQEIIHSTHEYYFIAIEGKRKTDIYNKGLLDGTKKPFLLFNLYEDVVEEGTTEVIAFERNKFNHLVFNGHLSGRLSLDKTFLISTKEANTFIEEYCWNCDSCGTPNCFQESEVDCGKEDRDRYREPTWFARQRELVDERKERKKQAFPA